MKRNKYNILFQCLFYRLGESKYMQYLNTSICKEHFNASYNFEFIYVMKISKMSRESKITNLSCIDLQILNLTGVSMMIQDFYWPLQWTLVYITTESYRKAFRGQRGNLTSQVHSSHTQVCLPNISAVQTLQDLQQPVEKRKLLLFGMLVNI